MLLLPGCPTTALFEDGVFPADPGAFSELGGVFPTSAAGPVLGTLLAPGELPWLGLLLELKGAGAGGLFAGDGAFTGG